MPEKDPESWNSSTALARAILHDRKERRRWMVGMMMVPVLMLAIGLWVIGGWLMESSLRFLLWWGGCAAATVVVMIFAVYDALAVFREEREKRTDVDPR